MSYFTKCLTCKHEVLGLDVQHLHTARHMPVHVCASTPRAGKEKTGGFLELTSQPVLMNWWSTDPVEEPVSKMTQQKTINESIDFQLLHACAEGCTPTCIHFSSAQKY